MGRSYEWVRRLVRGRGEEGGVEGRKEERVKTDEGMEGGMGRTE